LQLRQPLTAFDKMIATILRIFMFFWDIRKTGFYEIVTPFTYPQTQISFTFRSVIYLDADFYNFVPDMAKITQDYEEEDFVTFYHQCYRQHIQKIHDFMQNMNNGTAFWGSILVIPILIAMNMNLLHDIYLWILQGVVPDFVQDFLVFWNTGKPSKHLISLAFNILTLTGAFSIRSFLTKIAVKILMKVGFFIANVYKKRKARKQKTNKVIKATL
jgi:hypothetical protein